MSGLWFVRAVVLGGALQGAPEMDRTNADSTEVAESVAPAKVPRRNLLSVTAAVLPGVILHGSGHYAGGDRRVGWRLLAVESVGLGGVVAGFAGLALTGASRRVVGLFVATSATGASLLLGSGLADLYGVLAPTGGFGAALPFTPSIEAGAGMLYVRNPTFEYRWLGGSQVDFRWRRWRVGVDGWRAADGGTNRFGGVGAVRFFGAMPAGDGALSGPTRSFAELSLTVVHHREDRGVVPFRISTGSVRVDGRFELAGFADSLSGSFVEWGGGVSLAAHTYGGAVDASDASDALIARFGYGIYIGRDVAPRAEVVLFYDHAHDGFAGGLKMPGLGSGPLGHFGVRMRAYLTQHWGVSADLQAGSAHVFGLGLLYRYGRLSRS